jgi:ribosomal protein S18 acetylase RimI-like enzyme
MEARFAVGRGGGLPAGMADRRTQILSMTGRQPLSETIVRVLTEDDWSAYRALRLAGLQESPDAFDRSYTEEAAYSEECWRSRMRRASRLLAERDGVPRGIVSCTVVDEHPASADVYGLWVDPATRQAGVAWQLMDAVVRLATAQSQTQLYYWVGTENTRAIAFAINFGFRPSPERRPARIQRAEFGEEEIAMVLSVGSDPAATPNPTMTSFGSQSGPSI